MKVAYLTPGAGGMICGSCLNDNMLATELTRLGCDCVLVPLYTPIRTDEPDVSIPKVFFGGVNVYLQQKSGLFRAMPRWMDRALDSPRFLKAVTSRAISVEAKHLGELTVSMVRGEQGKQRKEIGRLVDWLHRDLKPDLVHLSNLMIAGCVPRIKQKLNVPVLVTLQGDDIFLDELVEPYRTEAVDGLKQLARQVDGFLTHSNYYADYMAAYFDIPREKFHVVPLGLSLTDFLPVAPSAAERPPTIGFLARICEAKGLHNLVDAFLLLREQPEAKQVRLHVAGYLGGQVEQQYFERERAKLEAAGALEAFHFAGTVERADKLQFLSGIDVLSVPTNYHEPKGRYVLEALASGIPVVQPEHGAFPELVTKTGGGRLVRPNDPEHLAATLHGLIRDADLRKQLGAAGRAAVVKHHAAEKAAAAVLAVFQNASAISRA